MTTRPNVVVFVPDQLRADAIGAFGNSRIQTPHIDGLAARGVRFDNAYVQHPLCRPSRMSFLTGWYPRVAAQRRLTNVIRPDEPSFLKQFHDHGYHVIHAGVRGDTFAPAAAEVILHEYGAVDLDEAIIRTAETWLRRPPKQPWLLYLQLLAPHSPFGTPEPWSSMYHRDSVPDPIPVPGAGDGYHPHYIQALRLKYGLQHVVPDKWRELIATYYAMVSRMDHHVGRVLSAVETAGLTDDTLFAFFTDHGKLLGDYGLIEKWPSAVSRNVTQAPLLLAGADLPRGIAIESMVELIDVFPTLLELAGIPDSSHRHAGKSLTHVMQHPNKTHREYAFTEGGSVAEDDDPTLAGSVFAVRDRRWTYIERIYEQPELYDRASDPQERVNLAGKPYLRKVEYRMRARLASWLQETTDVVEYPRIPTDELPIIAPMSDRRW